MADQSRCCSLSPERRRQALEEYAAASDAYTGDARIEGESLVVTLRGDGERIGPFLKRVVAQEAECCPFLRFDITPGAEEHLVRLSIDGSDRVELEHAAAVFFPAAVFSKPPR